MQFALGPVVQSIVSLTRSLVVKKLPILVSTISNSQVIFAEKKILFSKNISIYVTFNYKKRVRERSRECHNHKPHPFPDTKRIQIKPNKCKSSKRTESTKTTVLSTSFRKSFFAWRFTQKK